MHENSNITYQIRESKYLLNTIAATDLNGDPCAFTGLCVNRPCDGNQMMGSGETVIRELILTEAYSQQPFYTGTDLRIREITNGYDVTDAIGDDEVDVVVHVFVGWR